MSVSEASRAGPSAPGVHTYPIRFLRILMGVDGSSGSVLHDTKAKTAFILLGADGGIELCRDMASDG